MLDESEFWLIVIAVLFKRKYQLRKRNRKKKKF